MDPFHVVALAGDALDRCRQRIQQQTCGHRGRSGDPLYGIRRALRTGAELPTGRQWGRPSSVFAVEEHAAVQATWGIYQRIVQAYRRGDRAMGKHELQSVIGVLASDVPAELREVITLGRTLKRRAEDALAYFERPGTSNRPTEAINGRLEQLRGTALGFRNLAHYITRALSWTPEASDPPYTLNCIEPLRSWDIMIAILKGHPDEALWRTTFRSAPRGTSAGRRHR